MLELEQAPGLKVMLPNETKVIHIPNEDCDNTGQSSTYSDNIRKFLLCTTIGGDSCNHEYGSGWPLILKGDSYQDDIQLGISLRYVHSLCLCWVNFLPFLD